MGVTRKIAWVVLMVGLAGLLYLAFRGYLSPAMIIEFANSWMC